MTQPGRILVVDDDWPIVDFVAEALSDEGYTVTSAVSSSQAVTLIEAEHPDVILLDVHMPGLDGIQLMRYLQSKQFGDIQIVLMTADASIMQQVTTSDAQYFLLKPFDLQALLNCVAKALQAKRDQAQHPTLLSQAVPNPPQICQ